MKNTIEYKGYVGEFEYQEGDDAFHGIVLGLRDVIHFQGTCVAELKQSLQGSVNDYLAWCAEEGVPPEKPYTGRFVVRLAPDLHRSISVLARLAGLSLNQWVVEALARQLAAPGALDLATPVEERALKARRVRISRERRPHDSGPAADAGRGKNDRP